MTAGKSDRHSSIPSVELFDGDWTFVNLADTHWMPGGVFLIWVSGELRIKRLEQPIIHEAEETLEMVQHLRHRQRMARR